CLEIRDEDLIAFPWAVVEGTYVVTVAEMSTREPKVDVCLALHGRQMGGDLCLAPEQEGNARIGVGPRVVARGVEPLVDPREASKKHLATQVRVGVRKETGLHRRLGGGDDGGQVPTLERLDCCAVSLLE